MAVNGNKIKDLRVQAGITQEELGKKLGFVKQTVSNWEKNISEPKSETLTALSKLFGVSIDYLLDKTDDINTSVKNNTEQFTVNNLLLIMQKYDKEGFSESIQKDLSKYIPELREMVYLNETEEKLIKIFHNLTKENKDVLIGKAAELLTGQFDKNFLESYFILDKDTRIEIQNLFINYLEESRKHPEKKRTSEELVKEFIEQEKESSGHDSCTVDELEEEYKKNRLNAVKKKEQSA
ncbi:MAG: helix-turn-helix domain-containing protein, partial [Lachnospiraceae bacterium]